MKKNLIYSFLILLSILFCKNIFSQRGSEQCLIGDACSVDFGNRLFPISDHHQHLRQQVMETIPSVIDTSLQVFVNDTKGDTFIVYKYYSYGNLTRNDRYLNGNIIEVTSYTNKKINGNQYYYHKNGLLAEQTTYSMGKLTSWVQFYNDGKTKAVRINDSILGTDDYKSYFRNGTLSRHHYTDLKQNVTKDIKYKANGEISSNISYGAGKQKVVNYNNKGEVVEDYSFIDRTYYLVGECKYYYWSTGKLKEIRNYKNGKTKKEANIKDGIWQFWNEEGELKKEEQYENGFLVDRKHYPSKLEVTIEDTNIVKQVVCTDTVNNCWGYELGEKYYYIKFFGHGNVHDTVIVYYDEMKKDTMMFEAYHGYKNFSEKKWNREGKIIEIHDTELGINKAWYPNGQLKWDKVVTGRYSSQLDIDEKNKIWYSNGNVMYDYVKIGKDTMIEYYYYRNKNIKKKTTHCYHCFEQDGDGYQYPKKYFHYAPHKEEYFCENGQFTRSYNFGVTEKDVKTYYCNGNTRSYIEKYYKQMKLVGEFIYYYENGKINYKGHFKEHEEGEPQNVSVEVGEWTYYDVDGNVERIELFDENGEEIKAGK
jgi:antitoxin component YwqK of YwqJK toxin-antitoxin module